MYDRVVTDLALAYPRWGEHDVDLWLGGQRLEELYHLDVVCSKLRASATRFAVDWTVPIAVPMKCHETINIERPSTLKKELRPRRGARPLWSTAVLCIVRAKHDGNNVWCRRRINSIKELRSSPIRAVAVAKADVARRHF